MAPRRLAMLLFFAAASLSIGCASPRALKSHRIGFLEGLERSESYGRPSARADRSPSNTHGELTPARAAKLAKLKLKWPLRDVRVTSGFGQRGSEFHEGIDLRAKRGTTVYAAHSGRVLYAGEGIRGYGRMVIVRHPSGLATVYAHNSRLMVRKGQKIQAGQRIAQSGNTGQSTGPHLHFEIRDGVTAVDPLKLMPRVAQAHPLKTSRRLARR